MTNGLHTATSRIEPDGGRYAWTVEWGNGGRLVGQADTFAAAAERITAALRDSVAYTQSATHDPAAATPSRAGARTRKDTRGIAAIGNVRRASRANARPGTLTKLTAQAAERVRQSVREVEGAQAAATAAGSDNLYA